MTHSLASKRQERLMQLSAKENTQPALILVMSLAAAVTKIDDKRRLQRQWKEGGATLAHSSTGYRPG